MPDWIFHRSLWRVTGGGRMMVLPLPLPGNITIRDHIVRGNSWLLSHLYGEKNITQSNKKYSSVSVNEELRRSRGQEKEERKKLYHQLTFLKLSGIKPIIFKDFPLYTTSTKC